MRFDHLKAPLNLARGLHYDLNRRYLDETRCQFVSSRGIAKVCRPLVDVTGSYVPTLLGSLPDLQSGSPLYLYTSSLPEFVARLLPDLPNPITLVTGADDLSVSEAHLGHALIERLVGDPRVVAWYAQNLEVANPKMRPIPIGIDYHTLATNRSRPWREFQTPRDQERALVKARSTGLKVADRPATAYSNWHFYLDRSDRRECFEKIDHRCVFFEPSFVARTQSWENNGQHFFTLSPAGNGLDCHRTWEALALGTVPIVRTSGIDSVFDGLPVCIVQDWSEVTPAFLEQERARMLGAKFDYSRLFQGYWKDVLWSKTPARMAPVTIQEFIDGLAKHP